MRGVVAFGSAVMRGGARRCWTVACWSPGCGCVGHRDEQTVPAGQLLIRHLGRPLHCTSRRCPTRGRSSRAPRAGGLRRGTSTGGPLGHDLRNGRQPRAGRRTGRAQHAHRTGQGGRQATRQQRGTPTGPGAGPGREGPRGHPPDRPRTLRHDSGPRTQCLPTRPATDVRRTAGRRPTMPVRPQRRGTHPHRESAGSASWPPPIRGLRGPCSASVAACWPGRRRRVIRFWDETVRPAVRVRSPRSGGVRVRWPFGPTGQCRGSRRGSRPGPRPGRWW